MGSINIKKKNQYRRENKLNGRKLGILPYGPFNVSLFFGYYQFRILHTYWFFVFVPEWISNQWSKLCHKLLVRRLKTRYQWFDDNEISRKPESLFYWTYFWSSYKFNKTIQHDKYFYTFLIDKSLTKSLKVCKSEWYLLLRVSLPKPNLQIAIQ